MSSEELPNTETGQLSHGDAHTDENPPLAPGKRLSATQWIIGLAVLALLAFPLVRRAMESDSPGPTPAALSAKDQAILNQSFGLYQAGKFDEAITAANALVKDNPNAADGWNNLAASYAALGRWDDAIKSAQEAVRLAPGNKLAKGNLAYAQKAKASGAAAPRPAAPGTLEYSLNLSAADYNAGKFPECINDASQAIKLNAGSSEAFNNRGACYGSLGMFDEEIRDVQEAVRLNPGNRLAKNNLDWAIQQKKVRDSLREKK